MSSLQRILMEAIHNGARTGDRFVYDRATGTLRLHQNNAEPAHLTEPPWCFVGTDWTEELTAECASLYARRGGLRGELVRVDTTAHALVTFEIVG